VHLEKAAALDPKNGWVIENLTHNYVATRNYEMAEKTLDRGLEVAPTSFSLRATKAKLALEWKGDFSVAEEMFAHVPPGLDPEGLVTFGRISIYMLQRKFPEALSMIEKVPGEIVHTGGTAPTPKSLMAASVYLGMKDESHARVELKKARPIAEQLVREVPDDASRHAMLGGILAFLGQKEEAIREGKWAVELKPESKDAFDGPMYTLALAQIYAWIGEKDQALQLIERSLTSPNGITGPMLRLDPIWDPLRDDARFQALVKKYDYGAKA
jgi:serine/threonine-protein kinase